MRSYTGMGRVFFHMEFAMREHLYQRVPEMRDIVARAQSLVESLCPEGQDYETWRHRQMLEDLIELQADLSMLELAIDAGPEHRIDNV